MQKKRSSPIERLDPIVKGVGKKQNVTLKAKLQDKYEIIRTKRTGEVVMQKGSHTIWVYPNGEVV